MLPFLRNWTRLYPWVLSALAETAVAVPWLIFTYSIQNERRWPEALPGVWLLLLAYLAAGIWEAGTPDGEQQERSGRRRLIAMAVGLAGIYALAYAALPPAFRPGSPFKANLALSVLPVAGYLWFQGARSAAEGIEYARVFERFTWQCAAAVAGILLLIVVGSARDPRIQVLLAWSVPLLFTAGLTLLLVARERELRSSQARLGEQETGSGAGSPVATVLVFGLLGLTLAASWLLSVDRLQRMTATVWTVVDRPLSWLGDVVMLILYRWIMLLWLVVGPIIQWLLHRPRPQAQPQSEVGPGDTQQLLEELRGPERLANIGPYIKGALLMAALLLLAVWVYRLSRNVRKAPAEEEERISLGFWANLLADLRGLLAKRAQGLASLAALAPEALDPRDPRALYRKLQAWGAGRGRARRPGETPTAYQEALGGQQPGAAAAVAAVTAVYNQARYGAAPPSSEAVERAAGGLAGLDSPDSQGRGQ